jgi:hypothetical protein
MDFDWLDCPFDLHKITPREIEESFEDPFSIRLLPEGLEGSEHARYFNLGKTVGDRGVFTVFWTDGKKYRAIASRDMVQEEVTFYERKNSEMGF